MNFCFRIGCIYILYNGIFERTSNTNILCVCVWGCANRICIFKCEDQKTEIKMYDVCVLGVAVVVVVMSKIVRVHMCHTLSKNAYLLCVWHLICWHCGTYRWQMVQRMRDAQVEPGMRSYHNSNGSAAMFVCGMRVHFYMKVVGGRIKRKLKRMRRHDMQYWGLYTFQTGENDGELFWHQADAVWPHTRVMFYTMLKHDIVQRSRNKSLENEDLSSGWMRLGFFSAVCVCLQMWLMHEMWNKRVS